MASIKNQIKEQNKKINRKLFNTSEKNEETISKLSKMLAGINNNRSANTNGNILEFFTNIELNNHIKSGNSKNTFDKNSIYKNIEENIKNSMQNFDFEDEKQRFRRYEDYRLVDSYIPELADCLDLYRDSILSPDDITKKSVNYIYNSEDISTNNDLTEFRNNLTSIEKKYKLLKVIKEETRNGLRDGDIFVIIIPLSEAFDKILKEDDLFVNNNESIDYNTENQNVITERYMDFDNEKLNNLLEGTTIEGNNETEKNKNKVQKIEDIKKNIIDDINKHVKYYNNPLDLLSDRKKLENKENTKINVSGSFFYVPKPESIIKLEIDDICFGYVYIEKNPSYTTFSDGYNSSFFGGMTQGGIQVTSYGTSNDVFNSRYDFINSGEYDTKYQILTDIFVKGISRKIDKKFIEDNTEFKNEIYTLLRNNYIIENDVKITFLEPSNVCHFKNDSNTTYGVSRLAKSLFFAKLYLSILITSVLTKISRGKDKRAFYVDVGMDEDFEGTVQSLIRDIKSKEVTTSSMKNITTMLNVVGTYEDFYIPTYNGERPFEIDTISGQQVDINDDFLDFLLKSTIGGTGVPINYIDATKEIDFARTLSMQNSGFVRGIISDQEEFGEFWSEVVRKLYYNEYLLNEHHKEIKINDKTSSKKKKTNILDINKMKIVFPPPIYLSLTNLNEQVSNISQNVDFITNLYFGEANNDEKDTTYERRKLEFRREITKKYLSTSMDWELFNDIFNQVNKNDNVKKLNDEYLKDDEEEENNGY